MVHVALVNVHRETIVKDDQTLAPSIVIQSHSSAGIVTAPH